MNSQNLWSSKADLIFPKNFVDFWLDVIKKQSIINLSSYSSISYAFVVLVIP